MCLEPRTDLGRAIAHGGGDEKVGLGQSEVQRRAVGWRSDGGGLAVYGGRGSRALPAGATFAKRQPVGTGRRWTGACGLIPVYF